MKREAQALLDEGFELPFKKGVFRYESSAVLDESNADCRSPRLMKCWRKLVLMTRGELSSW